MRRTAYIFIVIICGLYMVSCTPTSEHQDASVKEIPTHRTDVHNTDTLLLITMPKDALWGHLGEATGMSVIEFITDGGDTLYLRKESEITGRSGIIYGSIRNYTDRFCITTTDGGETLLKAVNVSQMQELWAERTLTEEK
ncbi:MAG: hypothetical protein NC113_01485 [Bacteroides sp.]|nr:hypothetical protein [Bacteroides sp.]MCM1446896.1 hypothetical protein [Bacteroides sp.]MCM1515338.1 hypothetical protein [Paraprevotella sp.]